MRNRLVILFAALLLALPLAACGDDDDDTTDTGTVSDAGDVTPDETPDVTPDETPDVTPDETPTGACTGDADLAIIGGGVIDPNAEATTCGLGCLADDDPVACSTTCVVAETGLSTECSGCYAATVGCSIDNCLTECAADPSSEACETCQIDAGCISDFYACSGLTPPEE